MSQLLDLAITLTPPGTHSAPEIRLGSHRQHLVALRCTGYSIHEGDLLTDPLKSRNARNLRWYLEEYWKWPFEGLPNVQAGVEALLARDSASGFIRRCLGKPSSDNDCAEVATRNRQGQRQISIVSDIPRS